MGQIQSIDELIGLLIRRRLLIGAITVFGIVLTLLYVISKPDVFEATAVIQVQSPTVSDPRAEGTRETSQSAQRLQTIEQRLTTRENMLAVIERHKLFEGSALSDDEKVHLLRMSLRFETVASAASANYGAPTRVSALLIYAQADTREKAARVANDFAQGILDASVEGQSGRTREAAAFYKEEVKRLSAEIDAIEAERATFVSANSDALPAQRDLRQTELIALNSDLRDLDQALVIARNELSVLDKKSTKRATDRRQMQTLTAQIETLSAQRDALVDRRAAIQNALVRTPQVDRTLADFERSLDQLQSQYEVSSRRAAEAETSQKLEDRQQGETFTMLERAIEPEYPISGGRRKLAAAGAIVSLFAAICAAFVMDLLNPALRTRAQLERQLDLRAVVAIPEIRHIGKRKRRGFWGLGKA